MSKTPDNGKDGRWLTTKLHVIIKACRDKVRESVEEMIKSGEIKKEDKVEDLIRKL